jgi:hypothetical protein
MPPASSESNRDRHDQLSYRNSPLPSDHSSVTEEGHESLGRFTEITPLLPGASPRAIDGETDDFRTVLWEELKYLTKTSLQVFVFVHFY